jgi:hypothetical protein
MGHNVDVHEAVYRIHDSTIELAKIGRLLMAVHCGVIDKFAGKSLDEIQLHGIPKNFCIHRCSCCTLQYTKITTALYCVHEIMPHADT